MKTRRTVIALKGDRRYVQGPDMFNAMIETLGGAPLTALRFSIHNDLDQGHIEIAVSEKRDALPKADERAAWLVCVRGSQKVFVSLSPIHEQPIIERSPYDESRITDRCLIEDDHIVLRDRSDFSFVETIVAMHKNLLQAIFPEAPGRWAFTKLELDQYPIAAEELAVAFTGNLGYRLVKSRVLSKSRPVGSIFFTVWDT